ncbi:MAG: DegV family protein [Candidatus Paceibacterota bacterium]|jgi:DegV family protein with EDD domain
MEEEQIGIVADEAVDLPEEIIKENDISLVRFKIDLQQLAQFSGNIYQKMEQSDKQGVIGFVKTSQPSINDFAKVFEEKLKHFKEVLCFTISSKISGTYNSAIQAQKFLSAELRGRIHVIDTFNGSAGEGLVALEAIKHIKQGLNAQEIVGRLNAELKNFKLLGVYQDGKWLEASGRIPHFVQKGAERMGLKPLFGFKEGKLALVGIKRNIEDLASALFQEFEKNTRKIRGSGKKITASVTHADNESQARKLKELLSSINVDIAFLNLTCIPLGGHLGPGALILGYHVDNNL